jgi:hypothetical protein
MVGAMASCGLSDRGSDPNPQAVEVTVERTESDSCITETKSIYVVARDVEADISAIDLDRDGQPEAVLRGDDAHVRLLGDKWARFPLEGVGSIFFTSTVLHAEIEDLFRIHVQGTDFVGPIRERIDRDPANPQPLVDNEELASADDPRTLSWKVAGDTLISWSVEQDYEGVPAGEAWRMEYRLLDQSTAEELAGFDTGSPPLVDDLAITSVFSTLALLAPDCWDSQAEREELLSCLHGAAGDMTVAEWIERDVDGDGEGDRSRPDELPFECM